MNTLSAVHTLEVTSTTVFESVGEALEYGLPLSLFGFATVFGVLVLIWAILGLFKVFFYSIPNAKKNGAKVEMVKESPVPKVEVKAEQAPAPVVTASAAGNDAEIVAAIIAAIEAYRTQTGTAVGGFRVVSFKKRI